MTNPPLCRDFGHRRRLWGRISVKSTARTALWFGRNQESVEYRQISSSAMIGRSCAQAIGAENPS